MKEVGKKIRETRKQKNMTLEELADKLGKTKSYLSKLERSVKPISLENLQLIANALNVEVEELISDKQKVENPFTEDQDWFFVIQELKKRGISPGDLYLKVHKRYTFDKNRTKMSKKATIKIDVLLLPILYNETIEIGTIVLVFVRLLTQKGSYINEKKNLEDGFRSCPYYPHAFFFSCGGHG